MKTVTLHTLQAMLSTMLLSGILLSAEPPSKNNVLPPGTHGAPRRPNSRFTGDPPPTKKIVYKSLPVASLCAGPNSAGRLPEKQAPQQNLWV